MFKQRTPAQVEDWLHDDADSMMSLLRAAHDYFDNKDVELMYEPRAVRWARLLTGTDITWKKARNFYSRPFHAIINSGDVYKASKLKLESHLNSSVYDDGIIPYEEAFRCLRFEFQNHSEVKLDFKNFSKLLNCIIESCELIFNMHDLKIQYGDKSYTTLLEFRGVLLLTEAKILKEYRDEVFSISNLKFVPSNFFKSEHNFRCVSYDFRLQEFLDLANSPNTLSMTKLHFLLKI